MKKWEEERRKKIYKKKLKQAKSIVNTNNRPKSSKTPGLHSKNLIRQSTAGSARSNINRGSTEYFVSPVSEPASTKVSDILSEEISVEYEEIPLDQTLIFKLLQAFKLQQYAKKLREFGFGMEIYKLAILSEKERDKLIENLRPLPGHGFKFEDMFTFLEAVYPRDSARRELRKPGNMTHYSKFRDNRVLASSNQIHHKTKKKKKSLVKRYERLDPYKRELINKRFLDNLKVKGGMNIASL